jgi:hypothetical protein
MNDQQKIEALRDALDDLIDAYDAHDGSAYCQHGVDDAIVLSGRAVLVATATPPAPADGGRLDAEKEFDRWAALVNICQDVWDERQCDQIRHIARCAWNAAIAMQSSGKEGV